MTELGYLGSGPLAEIDTRGVARLPGWTTGVDWWVGAEDRWHFASEEPAVRQATEQEGSVIASRMKVPGGDIVHRSFAVPLDGDGALVIEITNDTPIPVVVALEVRGQSAQSLAPVGEVVSRGKHGVLRASKAIAAFAAGTDPSALRKQVVDGKAETPADRKAVAAPADVAVVLWPLPHTATLRVVVPFATPDPIPQLDYIPSAEAVGRGWDAHVQAGMRVSVPNDQLDVALSMARRHVLAGADPGFDPQPSQSWERALFALALDGWGHHQVALDMLLYLTSQSTPEAERRADHLGATAWALANHVACTGDTALVDAAKGWLSDAVATMARLATTRSLGRRLLRSLGDAPEWLSADDYVVWSKQWAELGLLAAVPALELLGERTTAADIRAAVAPHAGFPQPLHHSLAMLAPGIFDPTHTAPTLDELAAWAATASATGGLGGTGREHDPVASALLMLGTRLALVDDRVEYGNQGESRYLRVLQQFPETWTGAGIEVHNAPTVAAPLSYGIRWHGPRPALLWQRAEDHALSLETATLMVPGLDDQWSTADARGETLLAGTGVVVDASPITPAAERGQALGDPPDEHTSFS